MKKEATRNNRNFLEGMTLVELLIAAGILVLTLSGILVSYVACLELAEISKKVSLALYGVKGKMEEIQNKDFNQIKATYDNTTFTLAGFNGIGVSYVDDNDPDLLLIDVVFCWQQANGRLIGEDQNLNGQLDPGEDQNGNGRLDSLVEVTSQIFQR